MLLRPFDLLGLSRIVVGIGSVPSALGVGEIVFSEEVRLVVQASNEARLNQLDELAGSPRESLGGVELDAVRGFRTILIVSGVLRIDDLAIEVHHNVDHIHDDGAVHGVLASIMEKLPCEVGIHRLSVCRSSDTERRHESRNVAQPPVELDGFEALNSPLIPAVNLLGIFGLLGSEHGEHAEDDERHGQTGSASDNIEDEILPQAFREAGRIRSDCQLERVTDDIVSGKIAFLVRHIGCDVDAAVSERHPSSDGSDAVAPELVNEDRERGLAQAMLPEEVVDGSGHGIGSAD